MLDIEMVERLKKRIRLAYLEAAIIGYIANEMALDTNDIVKILKNQYLKKLSPGTLFPVLHKLEREGYIQKLLLNRKMLYSLTLRGKIALNSIEASLENFQEILVPIKRKGTNR